VLAVGGVLLLRDRDRARTIAIAATTFALIGFLVGISETARGGDAPDIAYHATVIPLLIAVLALLARDRWADSATRRPAREERHHLAG
jgi:hypothetical protein